MPTPRKWIELTSTAPMSDAFKARRNTGATFEEIAEVILQTTVYCGVPAALEAFREFERVLAEEAEGNTNP
ncbi:MAG: carboxymuconolactone decarboxylase family protein [Burkholderiales bacterium]